MARPLNGTHCRLRKSTLPLVNAQYHDLDCDQLWRVTIVNGGYGRDALHLVQVKSLKAEAEPDARRIVVWRGQVQGEPRCDYCRVEGHSSSTGVAATCTVRAAEVAEQRRASSERMKAYNASRPRDEKVPF